MMNDHAECTVPFVVEAESSAASTPTGTLTFLFTDIEGSTQRWQQDAKGMSSALADHDEFLRQIVARTGGTVFKHTGDGICAAFGSARDAAAAALAAQASLHLPVRIGLHTGEAERRGDDFFGPALNCAARVMDAGHGGQILVSSTTAVLLRSHALLDLGEHHLKGLDEPERIFQLGDGKFPPLRAPAVAAGNLPAELSTFIGRQQDVKELMETVGHHRSVTLFGVGGTGKTRLALEAARRLHPSFPDGCWLVELGLVNLDDAVPYAFAAALGVPLAAEQVLDELVARWEARRALLVVDNCEHVLTATADVVQHLLAHCPSLTVLATSREPLLVAGERVVAVGSLAPQEAVQLFLERASAEAPDLAIDDAQMAAVEQLCARLDGLPLALELAASRSRVFTPVELVGHLSERFRLLVGSRRGRLERHQTMRGTLDWSYDLCSPKERSVFDRLSVIQGPFDMTSAVAVTGDDSLDEHDVQAATALLVDRSLVLRFPGFDGTSRFRLLETMRAYGREHLQQHGAADRLRARHADHLATILSALSLERIGPQEAWAQEREIELLPDALVAMEWFIDRRDWDSAIRLVSAPVSSLADREVNAMGARLMDAVRAAGDEPEVLTELFVIDMNRWSPENFPAMIERCWQEVRTSRSPPQDRAYWSPELTLSNFQLSETEADELLAGLVRHRGAPPITRVTAEWGVIRGVVHSGWLNRVDDALAAFEQYVRGIGSPLADVMCTELHGTIARQRHQWAEAADWYGQVVTAPAFQAATHFGVLVAFHHLATRALAGQASDLTGSDLRDPWIHRRELALSIVDHHGAISTATALDRLSHHDLARRLVGWYATDADARARQLFDHIVAAAGLQVPEQPTSQTLDELLEEVFAIADALDS
jgi:predicted ATPase/class 3 adenylate cyclase